MSVADDIPDRLLVTALELAVGVAAAGAKLRPPLSHPAALRPYLRFQKLPPKALQAVRAALDADDGFRARIGSVATPDQVDEVGRLWLTRPDGWLAAAHQAMSADPETAGDLAAELRRAERRRLAAEAVAHRSLARIAAQQEEIDRLTARASRLGSGRSEVARTLDGAERARQELATALRHANDRLAAVTARLDAAKAEVTAAKRRAADAERVRDQVLASRADWIAPGLLPPPAVTGNDAALSGLADAVAAAEALTARLREVAGSLPPTPDAALWRAAVAKPPRGKASTRRRPIGPPKGLTESSPETPEHLVRADGIVVIVDGYNVAKLGWPALALDAQRERSIEVAEDVVRRYGTNVAVTFDGASVPGGSTRARRLVRVRFSPEGVTADDDILAELRGIPPTVPVAVVTNDQAIVSAARALGADVISSDAWLDLAAR